LGAAKRTIISASIHSGLNFALGNHSCFYRLLLATTTLFACFQVTLIVAQENRAFGAACSC